MTYAIIIIALCIITQRRGSDENKMVCVNYWRPTCLKIGRWTDESSAYEMEIGKWSPPRPPHLVQSRHPAGRSMIRLLMKNQQQP